VSTPSAHDPNAVLAQRIHVGGATKAFGEVTLDEVRGRAAELRSAAGWGPTARVGPVARAWAELAAAMGAAGAATVGDLGAEAVDERAEALWIRPPGGSLL
jgi:hypothetical protein